VTWPPLLKALLTPAWWLTAPMFAGGGTAFVVAAALMLLAILAPRDRPALEGAIQRARSSTRRRGGQEVADATIREDHLACPVEAPFRDRPPRPTEVALVWKTRCGFRVPVERIAYVGSAPLIGIAYSLRC
jgi:hypothetical protein